MVLVSFAAHALREIAAAVFDGLVGLVVLAVGVHDLVAVEAVVDLSGLAGCGAEALGNGGVKHRLDIFGALSVEADAFEGLADDSGLDGGVIHLGGLLDAGAVSDLLEGDAVLDQGLDVQGGGSIIELLDLLVLFVTEGLCRVAFGGHGVERLLLFGGILLRCLECVDDGLVGLVLDTVNLDFAHSVIPLLIVVVVEILPVVELHCVVQPELHAVTGTAFQDECDVVVLDGFLDLVVVASLPHSGVVVDERLVPAADRLHLPFPDGLDRGLVGDGHGDEVVEPVERGVGTGVTHGDRLEVLGVDQFLRVAERQRNAVEAIRGL